jgi:hypothetical protein
MTLVPAFAILIVGKRTRSEIVSLTPDQERELRAHWEKQGPTQVRSDLDHGRIAPALFNVASTWLSEKEHEADRRREAFNFEQIEIARAASRAAERAATAAENAAEEAARASAAAERQAIASERQATATERANLKANIAIAISIATAVATVVIAIVSIMVTHWDAHK